MGPELMFLLALLAILLSPFVLASWLRRLRRTWSDVFTLLLIPMPAVILVEFLTTIAVSSVNGSLRFALLYPWVHAVEPWHTLCLLWLLAAGCYGGWALCASLFGHDSGPQHQPTRLLERKWDHAILASMLVFFTLSGAFVAYLHNYVTLDEAIRRHDLNLIERRLKFDLLGQDANNAIISPAFSSDTIMLTPALPYAKEIGDPELTDLLLRYGAEMENPTVPKL